MNIKKICFLSILLFQTNIILIGSQKNDHQYLVSTLRAMRNGSEETEWVDSKTYCERSQMGIDMLNEEHADAMNELFRRLAQEDLERAKQIAKHDLSLFKQNLLDRDVKYIQNREAIAQKEKHKNRKMIKEDVEKIIKTITNQKMWAMIDARENKMIGIENQAKQNKKAVDAEFLHSIQAQQEQAKQEQRKKRNQQKQTAHKSPSKSAIQAPPSNESTSPHSIANIDNIILQEVQSLPLTEYEKYQNWLNDRKFVESKVAAVQKQKNINDAKELLKCKPGQQRDAKKRELEKQTLSFICPWQQEANRVLTRYSQLLHTNTSLQQFQNLAEQFDAIDNTLSSQGQKLKWYLASNPEMYNNIKQKYRSLQGRMNATERNKIIKDAEENPDNEKLHPQVLQIATLDTIRSFHQYPDGILNASNILHPATSPDVYQNRGTLSHDRLLQAKQRITDCLVSTSELDFHTIKPIVSKLITEINIEPQDNLIHGIIDRCSEIALVKAHCNKNYINQVGALFYDQIQRESEMLVEPYTQNQIADLAKIHMAVIKATKDCIRIKKDNCSKDIS